MGNQVGMMGASTGHLDRPCTHTPATHPQSQAAWPLCRSWPRKSGTWWQPPTSVAGICDPEDRERWGERCGPEALSHLSVPPPFHLDLASTLAWEMLSGLLFWSKIFLAYICLITYTLASFFLMLHGIPSYICAQSLSCVRLFVTPWTVAHQAPLSMDFPGNSTGVGCHFFLQGIFPTQGSNMGLYFMI